MFSNTSEIIKYFRKHRIKEMLIFRKEVITEAYREFLACTVTSIEETSLGIFVSLVKQVPGTDLQAPCRRDIFHIDSIQLGISFFVNVRQPKAPTSTILELW